jgi:hypothetical protein
MKKNICLVLVILVWPVFFSCTGNSIKKEESPKMRTDTSAKIKMAGNDVDEHGCKTSSGYQWSAIKNKCIKIFEDGTRLNPLEAVADKTTAAYIVFSGDNNKAELFLPDGRSSTILERRAEGLPWINGEWMLIAWKGYVLKKNGMAVYGGM